MALLNPKKPKTSAYTTEQLVALSPGVQEGLRKASQGSYGAENQQTALTRLGGARISDGGGVLPKYASDAEYFCVCFSRPEWRD